MDVKNAPFEQSSEKELKSHKLMNPSIGQQRPKQHTQKSILEELNDLEHLEWGFSMRGVPRERLLFWQFFGGSCLGHRETPINVKFRLR